MRHLAPEDAAFGIRPDRALAGDDRHERKAVMLGAVQEVVQRLMRPALGHAVQVEPCIDLATAARQFRALLAAERDQWRDRRPDRLGRGGRYDLPLRHGRLVRLRLSRYHQWVRAN